MTSHSRANCIFHICARAEAVRAMACGEYRAPSLRTEGFIHLSQVHQVRRVLDAFYAGQSDLVVLVVEPGRVRAPLRYEAPSSLPLSAGATPPDASQLFPHVYGPLNTDAVTEVVAVVDFFDGFLPAA